MYLSETPLFNSALCAEVVCGGIFKALNNRSEMKVGIQNQLECMRYKIFHIINLHHRCSQQNSMNLLQNWIQFAIGFDVILKLRMRCCRLMRELDVN